MSLLIVCSLPLLAAVAFAIAAALHYSTAIMRQAQDLPNLPMAMVGGAAAGGVATILALGAAEFLKTGPSAVSVGVVFAGLAGEYLSGRVDDLQSALVRGVLCALTFFPAAAWMMSAVLLQSA